MQENFAIQPLISHCLQLCSKFAAPTVPVDGIEAIEAIGDRHIKIKVLCEDSAEIDFLLGMGLNGENLLVE
ncbi:hypothetical protein CPter91_3439 [Collimonas pratensis]|uniref:Uncharacterized protein n=1 Tax=Collimonas pratensis TaxID=279113 RepID=A0A127Q7G1_9BURK|nr:hypothetical protein CPter91_3439 [Collimonas pratensis]